MSWLGKVVRGLGGGCKGTVVPFEECHVLLTALLAEGGYSYVYTAREVGIRGRQFAVKKVLSQDTETRGVAETEIKLLRAFSRHPAFVTCYGTTSRALQQNQYEYWMLLEFCPNGSLVDLLFRKNKKGEFEKQERLPEHKILQILEQVSAGLVHMHSRSPPVTHRDLKLENVLCAADGRYVLCDFGSSTTRRLEVERTRGQIVVEEERIHKYSTLMYRAPEMCDLYRKAEVAEKVDCWALGCILYSLCFGDHPFASESMLQILNAAYTIPEAHGRPPQLVALVETLLEPDPSDRLSAEEAMQWARQLKKNINAPLPEPSCPERKERLLRRRAEKEEERMRLARQMAPKPRAEKPRSAKNASVDWAADFSSAAFEGIDEKSSVQELDEKSSVARIIRLVMKPQPNGRVAVSCSPLAVSVPLVVVPSESLETEEWEASFETSFEPPSSNFKQEPAEPPTSSLSAPTGVTVMPIVPPPPASAVLPPPPAGKLPAARVPAGNTSAPPGPTGEDHEFGDFRSCDLARGGDNTKVVKAHGAVGDANAVGGASLSMTIDDDTAARGEAGSRSQMNQRSSDDFGDFAGADQPTSEGLEGTPLIPGGDLD